MRTHKYKGIMSTIKDNICGDGYDAEIRADKIFNKVKNKIDKAYQQGRAEAIDEMESMLTNKDIAQTYDFDDVLCKGNYDANFNDFRNYVRAMADQLKEQLKENKNE